MTTAQSMDGLVTLRADLLRRALTETSCLSDALGLARQAYAFVAGEAEPPAMPPPVAAPSFSATIRLDEMAIRPDAPVVVVPLAAAPAPAAGTGLWTEADKHLVVQMLRDGAKVIDIAGAVSRSVSAINSFVHKMGGRDALLTVAPAEAEPAEPAPLVPPVLPPKGPFTADEVQRLGQALEDGATQEQAAEYLARPIEDIRQQLVKAGGRDAWLGEWRRAQMPAPPAPAPQPSTFNTYPSRRDGARPEVTPEERAAIDARVAAGGVTQVATNFHRGHEPQILKDLS
ncbi:MAG: hypothetical protein PW843_24330 [Azospirillaceae bacterium]|nr:hypothetical protein [Azospirillaceae bacterium]